MPEGLAWIGVLVALAVGAAAFVLNAFYIGLALKQLGNAKDERKRLRLEIEKLEVETLRLRKLFEGDSTVR